jgi:hypothetical protein
LENLSEVKDINMAWENIKPLNAELNPTCHLLALLGTHHIFHVSGLRVKENIKTSAKESLGLCKLKQQKPWFDEECLGFLDQRKQTKMQWIPDPNQNNVDNLNNERRDATRHFRNKRNAYLKAKIQELEPNSKIKNIMEF